MIDSTSAITGDERGNLQLWNLEKGLVERVLEAHKAPVGGLEGLVGSWMCFGWLLVVFAWIFDDFWLICAGFGKLGLGSVGFLGRSEGYSCCTVLCYGFDVLNIESTCRWDQRMLLPCDPRIFSRKDADNGRCLSYETIENHISHGSKPVFWG